MIGVVLWSDTTDGKAVFWCEDQGDLAYFHAEDVSSRDQVEFNVGDVVRFEVTCERNLRRAKGPKLLEQNACSSLADDLRSIGVRSDAMGQSEVVTFQSENGFTRPEKPLRRAANEG